MDEPVPDPFTVRDLRPLDHALLPQATAGVDEPLLPRLWGLRFLVGVDQQPPAHRAAVILSLEQLQGLAVQRWGFAFATSLSPVPGQGGIVRGRTAPHLGMVNEPRPGELGEVGTRLGVAEHPPVSPGPVEPAEVPGGNPVPRVVRMRVAP